MRGLETQLGEAEIGRCHICAQTFRTKEDLERHLREAHGGRTALDADGEVCHLCSKTFSAETLLSAHLLQAHGLRTGVRVPRAQVSARKERSGG